MSYLNTDILYNKIKEANTMYYETQKYKLYYKKLNKIICNNLSHYKGFISPEQLQNMSLTEIVNNEKSIIEFLSYHTKDITYMPNLDFSCYIDSNENFDFGKIYSYYLSTPDTTDKLSKITYLSLMLNTYINENNKNNYNYIENEDEHEDDKESRIYYWTMADKFR